MATELNKFASRITAAQSILLLAPVLLFAQVTWTQKPNVFVGTRYPRACWAGDKVIVVASGGMILTSADESLWTASTSPTSEQLNSVAWTGSQAVAVGNGGAIVTSPTGVEWTNQNSGTGRNLRCVVQAGGQLVAVGDSGAILTSPDGVAWTNRTSPTVQALYGVAWTGAQIVAVGDGTTLSSADGITWTAHSFSTSLWDVVWTGTRLVAVGSNSTHVTSEDGIDWAAGPAGPVDSVTTEAIVWNGKVLVGVDNPGVVSSPDGVFWTVQNFTGGYTMNCVIWTGAEFVAFSISGEVYVSPFDTSAAFVQNIPLRRSDRPLTLSTDGTLLKVHFPLSMMNVPGWFSVCSLAGKSVMKQKLALTSEGCSWDIRGVAAGTYVFSVRQNGTCVSKTFLKAP